MKKHEVLVIQPKSLLRRTEMDFMRELILKQKEEGVIVLPAWCDVTIVSGDVKIVVAEEDLGSKLKMPKECTDE